MYPPLIFSMSPYPLLFFRVNLGRKDVGEVGVAEFYD